MFRTWITITLAGFLLAGCADSTSDNDKERDASATEAENITTPVGQTPSTDPIQIQAETSSSSAGQASTGSVKLNPAHGEPGHDCAIPVGAPLDGSGGQTPTATMPTITQQPSTQPSIQGTAQPSVKGAAPANGINPPHGEPGHDCAVAVGAPLPAK